MSDSVYKVDSTSGARGGARPGADGWERDLVNRLAFAALHEQRRARRWGIFFKLLLAVYLATLLVLYWPGDLLDTQVTAKDHTALVEVEGIIAEGAKASADTIVKGLREAFEDKHTKGVILRVNSPGGSPVQAGYVYDEILRLRKKYPKVPLYAVVTDLCASGGYYLAAAADKIYADKGSIVGSIGVRMGGFGFVSAMEKLGVERRLLTAGEHKGLLDPFSPVKQDEVVHIEGLLDEIHQQFIDVVKKGRGDRLADDERIFSGLIWTGAQAKEMGLVDALGSSGYVAREVIGEEKIVDFTSKPDYLERLAERIGMATGRGISEYLGTGAPGLQ